MRRAGAAAADGTADAAAGFTLVEVMIALAILSLSLVSMLVFTANNVFQTARAASENVAVDLARGKMYDLEEELLAEGFQELSQERGPDDFSDEGWPDYAWSAVIEKIELPDATALQAGAQASAAAEAEGGGATGAGGTGSTSGPLGMLGIGLPTDGTDPKAAAGDVLLSGNFELIRGVLEKAIRKITLTVRWTSGGEPQSIVLSYYVTKPSAVGEALPGMGGGAGTGTGTGSGAGSGTGTGTGTGTGRGAGTGTGTGTGKGQTP